MQICGERIARIALFDGEILGVATKYVEGSPFINASSCRIERLKVEDRGIMFDVC